MSFNEPLIVKIEGRFAVLEKDFYFYYFYEIKNFYEPKPPVYIHVPKGFRSDFASAPRIFYSLFPPIGKHSKACFLHDFLYSKYSNEYDLSREEADKYFLQAMFIAGVSKWQRYSMYYAVRLFGKLRYKK
jgi:hypothetical protein